MKGFLRLSISGFVLFSFFFLRFFHLQESFHFGTDSGLQLLEIYQRYKEKKISLIGPYSSFVVEGRHFYFGPAPYYLPLPFLLLFNWDPLSQSYFLIFFQFFSLVACVWALIKKERNYQSALFFSLFLTFFPPAVEHSRFFWNPNFLLPLSGFVLSLLIFLSFLGPRNWLIFFLGFLFGLGMQFHYSFFLAIISSFLFLFFQKKLNKKNLLFLFLGLIVGFSPLIIFELRHNFYNSRTILLFFSKKESSQVFSLFQTYYLLPLWPFLFFPLAHFFSRLKNYCPTLVFFFFSFFIFLSLLSLLPFPKQGYLMTSGWNYPGIKKATQIILEEKKENYNLLDLLTGDTRAMALRYLLTIAGWPPLGVADYPKAKFLFLYSREPIEKIISGSVWELDVCKPYQIKKTWLLQNGIFLYLLERNSFSL